jgi:mannose-1-phosphate guanylyltransferase
VLVEPAGRDTGPALAYAAHRIREQVGECVLCCLPSDHHVAGDFAATMTDAAGVAVETSGLVTVGVEPTRPATGYGYIEPGPARDGYAAVERFVEKPDAATAERYVEQGFRWNAGLFAWTPSAFLDAARETVLGPLIAALDRGDAEAGFAEIDPVSVDHAVLEGADDVFVVPAGFDWDDLGSWDALWRLLDRDADGNATLGETVTIDVTDSVLASDGHVSAVGVSNLVIANFDGHTLVVPRDDAERVRDVVDRLREQGRF